MNVFRKAALVLKWFRRKKDDKALANNAEQELSTIKKLDIMKEAQDKLDALFTERRYHIIPVELNRRKA